MKTTVMAVGNNIKNLFRDKINIVVFLLLVNAGLILYVYDEIMSRVDYRYFNLTKSLEVINDVNLSTYNGDLERELTTEEQLIRKQNKKWRLKNVIN